MKIGNPLELILLGISAAIPARSRHLSGQILVSNGDYFLIDCGEGTQFQLISLGIKYHKINNIFISHLHGDHFFGLIGLISTFHLLGRDKPLNIFCPEPLQKIITDQLSVAHTNLKYELRYNYLSENITDIVFENKTLMAKSFPLNHRVPTFGFRFDQKPKARNIRKDFIENYKPTVEEIKSIKKGDNFIDFNGNIIDNKAITIDPPEPLSYAYCSDTRFDRSIIKYLKNVSLLYHEATFDNSLADIAFEKYHSTAEQAAKIAKEANAKKLILGHFSGRNDDLKLLYNEAKCVFDNVVIGEEGITYKI